MSFLRSTTYSQPSGVHEADVAGAQLAVREGLGGGVGAAPVAGHDLGAADGDLALLAERQVLGPSSSTIRTTVSGPGTPTASVPETGSTGRLRRRAAREAQGAVHSVRP